MAEVGTNGLPTDNELKEIWMQKTRETSKELPMVQLNLLEVYIKTLHRWIHRRSMFVLANFMPEYKILIRRNLRLSMYSLKYGQKKYIGFCCF